MKQRIVEEARSWLGTAFCHQGRIKISSDSHGACDCLGLIMGVAKTLELKASTGKLFHLLDYYQYESIPDPNLLVSELDKHLIKVDTPVKGDVVLLSFIGQPQHLAIIGSTTVHHCERNEATSSITASETTSSVIASEALPSAAISERRAYCTRSPRVLSNSRDDGWVLQSNSRDDESICTSLRGAKRRGNLRKLAVQNYDYLTLIHAYMPLGKVCEHIFDKKWQRRAIAFYRFSF